MELEAQQRILDDHERHNLDFFTRIMNIRSREKTVTPPPKTAEKKTSLSVYHRSLRLINSRARIVNDAVEKCEVETVDSDVLEHLTEQVTDLQEELEVVLRELRPMKNEVVLLDEAIDLDKFLRKLKMTLKHPISTHPNVIKLLEMDKDEDAKSTNQMVPQRQRMLLA